MELFAKTVNGIELLPILTKRSILDVSLGSEYLYDKIETKYSINLTNIRNFAYVCITVEATNFCMLYKNYQFKTKDSELVAYPEVKFQKILQMIICKGSH